MRLFCINCEWQVGEVVKREKKNNFLKSLKSTCLCIINLRTWLFLMVVFSVRSYVL